MLGAEDGGESSTLGICGSPKFGVLWSTGRTTGDELLESVPERLRMPFLTAARTSARSLSPPRMLRLCAESEPIETSSVLPEDLEKLTGVTSRERD